MATPKTKYLIWFITLVLVMACVPTFAAQPIPTTDPNLIGTIIAQTANAAATQTVVAIPTLTSTITFTPTPRPTYTPEPTATATVLFLFFTASPVVLTQPSNNTGTTSNKPYACELLGSSPENGTVFASRTEFKASWKVKNTGKKDWEGNSVDYAYLSGDKIHKVELYDLIKTVERGDFRELIVDMLAPKNPGTYKTNWGLVAGAEYFCPLSLTIVVR